MESLIDGYNQSATNTLKRWKYTAFELPNLQQHQRNLDGFRKIWKRAYRHFDDEARIQTTSDLGKMLEEQKKGGVILAKILKCLEEKGDDTIVHIAKSHDPKRMRELENELVDRGLRRDEVAKFMEPVMENIRNINLSNSDQSTHEVIVNVEDNPKTTITSSVNPVFQVVLLPGGETGWLSSPPNRISPSDDAYAAYPSHTSVLRESTGQVDFPRQSGLQVQGLHANNSAENKWILCVDKTNGGKDSCL